MIRKKTNLYQAEEDISTYASRYDIEDLSITALNEKGMPGDIVKQLLQDELCLEGVPLLNLASFVTTWMEPQANDLILQCINKNFIDHDEYPQIEKIHARCVHILAELLHVSMDDNYIGTATIGSSEAIMLAGLAHKFNWRHRTKNSQMKCPNIVMGANVQICWDKFARYFEVEPRIIPLSDTQFTITAEAVRERIDENTICVATVLGTTFTGEYDEIQEINDLLVRIKAEKGWDIPLHVDAASGGFVAMFLDADIIWDFRLPQVKSINVSGHKYGLVYPGIGWLLFRDEASVPSDLVFEVNYLGGSMPTFTLNFSRGSAMVIAQYYNFLRLGKAGYRKIMINMMNISDLIVKGLLNTEKFLLLGTRRMEPVVSVALKHPMPYSVFDISNELRRYGWIVPAYTLPDGATHVASLRIVVKENLSLTLAKKFLEDVKTVLLDLERTHDTRLGKPRSGKNITH